MVRLIAMREDALDQRHQTEVVHLQHMLESKHFSPRTYDSKRIELDNWVATEKKDIEKY